jgi:hypothetical protein
MEMSQQNPLHNYYIINKIFFKERNSWLRVQVGVMGMALS